MCSLSTHTCVPAVGAGSPGQLRTEGREQVEESPGQDDDVVHAGVQDHHLTAVTHSCPGETRVVI